MQYAGYGGINPASTPVIDTLVAQGVTFTNTWAAPECSPSRAMYFNGRYSPRTSINSAIIPIDLANSSMNPNEVTTPRILRNAGYKSALIGKSHLTGYAVDYSASITLSGCKRPANPSSQQPPNCAVAIR